MKKKLQMLRAGLLGLLLAGSGTIAAAANSPVENRAVKFSEENLAVRPPFKAPSPKRSFSLLGQANASGPLTPLAPEEGQQDKLGWELVPGSAISIDPYAKQPILCPRLTMREGPACQGE